MKRTESGAPRDPREDLLGRFAPAEDPLVDVGQRVGPDALDEILDALGGQKVHIPERESFWRRLERRLRNERIRAGFRGDNYGELAEQWSLSERQVRTIVDGGH